MTTLTLRHASVAASAAAAAAIAALLTVPAAADQLATADTARAQAAALRTLAADPKTSSSVASLRAALPPTVTTEAATAALADLATGQHLTWTDLAAGARTTRVVPTTLGDVTVSTVTVTASVTGGRREVAALLADLATAKPLMTLQSATLSGQDTVSAKVVVDVHAAQPVGRSR